MHNYTLRPYDLLICFKIICNDIIIHYYIQWNAKSLSSKKVQNAKKNNGLELFSSYMYIYI